MTMEKFQHLIVPVKVEALCIGSKIDDETLGKSFTPSHGDFRDLAGFSGKNKPFLSDAYVRRPFTYESQYNLQAGVHLHWDLPRALKTGVRDTDKDAATNESEHLTYPTLPNRWLVTRIRTIGAGSNAPETRLTHWIVESDYLSPPRETPVTETPAKKTPATDLPWFQDKKDNLFRYMGRSVKLKDASSWSEDTAAERFDPLKALGYGEPAFTAYYPDCRTVFGFHDRELEDDGFNPEQDRLSYAVMGWYSNKSDDPVAAAVAENRLPDLLKEYRWHLPQGEPARNAELICSGFSFDVDWHRDTPLLPHEFDPNDVTVAVGNTASEGLATLLKSRKAPGTDGGEKLLQALQDGHMDTLDRLDALTELDKALHKDTFGTESGGLRWHIEAVQAESGPGPAPEPGIRSGTTPATTPAATPAATPAKTPDIPVRFIEALNTLNTGQAALNRTRDQMDTLRKQLYADWCKFMLCKYDQDRDGIKKQLSEWGISTNTILKFANAAIRDDGKSGLPPNPNTLSALEAQEAKWEKKIGEWTGETGLFRDLPPDFTLGHTEETAYHFPNEPVFTVSGKDLTPSSRAYGEKRIVHRQDLMEITGQTPGMGADLWQALIDAGCIDKSGLILSHLLPLETPAQISLPEPFDLHQKAVFNLFQRAVKGSTTCRGDSQLITSMAIRDTGVDVEVTQDQLTGLVNMPDLPDVPACTGPLLAERFFYLPCHGPQAMAAAAAGGDATRYTTLYREIDRRMADPDTYYMDCLQGGTVPQAVAANQWKWPWHPQFLHWKISYWPLEKMESTITKEDEETRTTFKPGLITDNFDFSDDHMELGQTGVKYAEKDPPEYMGITVLTPGAVENLKDRTTAFLESHRIQWVADLTRDLEDKSVLSQTISGYNESLLTFDSRLQFPIADPPERLDRYREFTQSVDGTVKGNYTASPVPNANFNPIRAGYMRITGIRVVDTFGQHRELPDPPTAVAASFTPQKPLETDYGKIYLPPRIVPPTRLTAYFIPERTPRAGAASFPENPILGWVVPNFLDRGVMMFDPKGTALGTVKASDDICVLRPPPGTGMPNPGGAGVHKDPKDPAAIVPGIKNQFLRDMVSSLLDKQPKELGAFIEILEKGMRSTCPESDSETPLLSLMVGRPLALVRLGVALDLKGFAAVNQGWNSFVWDVGKDNRDMGRRDTADFDRVNLPLQLGCRAGRNEYNDGLMGYYREKDATPDFGRFYSAYAASPAGNVQNGISLVENILMNCRCPKDDAPAETCLLLVDPQGKLNISTGILPGRQLPLAAEFYQGALARMSYTFLATPLLADTAGEPGTRAEPAPRTESATRNEPDTRTDPHQETGDEKTDDRVMPIPAPEEEGYRWSWVACRGETWSETAVSTEQDQPQWPPARPEILEGWLKLSRKTEEDDTHA